jgi:hypothetical protein
MAKVNIQIHIKMCIKNAIIAIVASVGNTILFLSDSYSTSVLDYYILI